MDLSVSGTNERASNQRTLTVSQSSVVVGSHNEMRWEEKEGIQPHAAERVSPDLCLRLVNPIGARTLAELWREIGRAHV